jgi:hypothetical protein
MLIISRAYCTNRQSVLVPFALSHLKEDFCTLDSIHLRLNISTIPKRNVE